MGAGSNVPITAGSGTAIDTFQLTGGDHQQIVRVAFGDTATTNNWTISTTASTSQIAADTNRLGIVMTNTGSSRVYLRFDSTAPTSTTYHWYLDSGDRWEIPSAFAQLAVSMLGSVANGNLISVLATAG